MTAKRIIGWREWVSLPDLNIPVIKAKIDTGARTSALHAFKLETFQENGTLKVRFFLHLRKKKSQETVCEAVVIDKRWVSDSGGHKEERYVIETNVNIANLCWTIEITLTNRDTMRFPMLLGRTAMEGRLIVDPELSYMDGKKPKNIFKE